MFTKANVALSDFFPKGARASYFYEQSMILSAWSERLCIERVFVVAALSFWRCGRCCVKTISRGDTWCFPTNERTPSISPGGMNNPKVKRSVVELFWKSSCEEKRYFSVYFATFRLRNVWKNAMTVSRVHPNCFQPHERTLSTPLRIWLIRRYSIRSSLDSKWPHVRKRVILAYTSSHPPPTTYETAPWPSVKGILTPPSVQRPAHAPFWSREAAENRSQCSRLLNEFTTDACR